MNSVTIKYLTLQDGIASPDDVDTAISRGLGLRHSFMDPFETMHLNVDGVEDYCKKYFIKEAMERKVLECQKEVERQ